MSAAKAMISVDAGAAFALMTSGSGYVREHAVKAAACPTNAMALALLVQRLNDWVPQVRLAAEVKLTLLRSKLSPSVVAGAFEYLLAFSRFERADPGGRALVSDLVATPAVLEIVVHELLADTSDRAVRLTHALLRTPILDVHLPVLSRQARGYGVRLPATKAILDGEHRWRVRTGYESRALTIAADQEATARRALKDRSRRVQSAALYYVTRLGRDWPDYQDVLLQFAGREGKTLGDTARWALNDLDMDWLAVLRTRFNENDAERERLAPILGRVGDATDAEVLWVIAGEQSDRCAIPFLEGAAFQSHEASLGRLNEIALRGGSFVTARRASRALAESRNWIDAASLADAAEEGESFLKRGLRRHYETLTIMQRLVVLAHLERSGVSIDAEVWLTPLHRYLTHGGFSPRASEITDLRKAVLGAPRVREWARVALRVDL